MSYSDALSREADWLAADLSASAIPPLLAGVGDGSGPFGVVAPYGRRLAQRRHQLFVCRDPYTERPMDARGQWRQADHGIALMVLWSRQAAGGESNFDQAELDQAVERIVDRVRGLPGDHTHGGRFFSVAEDVAGIRVEYPDPRTLDQPADAPLGAGSAYTVLVRYTATDAVAG